MNKKTIITALLALVAVLIVFIILIGHKQDTKKVAKTSKASKDSVEAMKQNDDVLTYDISSMQDVTSGLTIVIREYNQQGRQMRSLCQNSEKAIQFPSLFPLVSLASSQTPL